MEKITVFLIISIVLSITVVHGKKSTKKASPNCEEIKIRGNTHKTDVIASGLNRPYQLGVLKHHHKIFFTYNIGNDDTDTFNVGFIEKNHTGHKELENVTNGFAISVDNEKDIVYIGGSDGIYKYGTKETVEQILHDHNIWDLFHKQHLYFINFPHRHLYKLDHHLNGTKHERVHEIHEEINAFAIDKDGDIFFTNDTGLYMVANGSKKRVLFGHDQHFRCIELDNKGVVHLCGLHAVFVVNKKKQDLEKIFDIKNLFGLAFDHEDNIIYSNPHQIVRLLPGKCS